jgi:AcrR family transcriptional regulator
MNSRSAEITRNKILAAARQVFSQNGYGDASMRLIAQAAAISVGCLYIHFKNKEDLYLTLMHQWMVDLDEQTNEALARMGDPAASIQKFIEVTLDFARNHREIIMLQGCEIGITLGLELKQQFFRQRRLLLGSLVEQGVRSGVFCRCDHEDVTKVIFNALRGFVFSLVIDEEALFSAETCSNVILNGILRRNGE